MPNIIDIVGNKYNRLTVIKYSYTNKHRQTVWECLCDCGNKKLLPKNQLVTNGTKSCGCLKKEKAKITRLTHGMTYNRFYKIYHGMKQRCYNKNNHHYKYYGGRGIELLWEGFDDFKKDMYTSYKKHIKKHGEKDTSIDRINNNGNYCKENCRWATNQEQAENMSSNVKVVYNNKIIVLKELAKKMGINYGSLKSRLRLGWTIEQATSASKNVKLKSLTAA